MLTYILRRLLLGIFTLFLITLIVYALIRNMPGTPITQLADADPSRKISPEDMKRLEAIYGLDKPWYEAYFHWLGKVFEGDLGESITLHEKVTAVIGRRIGPTLLLSVTALILTYTLSIPLGLYSVVRRGKFDERITSMILYMLYSIPSFVVGIGLLIIFYQNLGWFPPGLHSDGYDSLSASGKFFDTLRHMFLPVLCYTYGVKVKIQQCTSFFREKTFIHSPTDRTRPKAVPT